MWALRRALTVLAILVVETNQFSGIPSAQFGSFDFLELESAAYQVEIASAPVSDLQLEEEGLHMPVMSRHGQLYSCSLPPPATLTEDTETEPSSETLPNITALLEHLGQNSCLVKTVGWWTYEYCHNMFVRQYHMEAGKIIGETKYLGFYEKETVWSQEHINRVKGLLESFKGNLVHTPPQAYHIIHFVNGTECDITGQPRSARVEIFCSLGGVDRLVEVKEEATCNYTLTVTTPLLCGHPMLVPLASSTPRHTLSCTPVVSQLDYEDYLLKQELIRQQKEKLKVLNDKDTSDSHRGDTESLLSSNNLLLRKLVMSSITQLAEIAYGTGSLGLGEEEERELDEIDDDDKEVAGTSSRTKGLVERQSTVVGESSSKGQSSEDKVLGDETRKVSEKMKRMAEDVKSKGKDSTLESLLSNLAVTAQYIESLEGNNGGGGDSSNTANDDEVMADETGEPGEIPSENEQSQISSTTDEGHTSVKGPPPISSGTEDQRTVETTGSSSGDGRAAGRSISSDIHAASEEEDEEEFDLDPEVVKEVEQQLQDALAKQLDTDDITVKIITLPEEQLQEMETEEEGGGGGEGGEGGEGGVGGMGGSSGISGQDREENLANAMSLLLDSLLGGADEPESEDKQRQSELAASYDQVWGREQRKQRTQKDT